MSKIQENKKRIDLREDIALKVETKLGKYMEKAIDNLNGLGFKDNDDKRNIEAVGIATLLQMMLARQNEDMKNQVKELSKALYEKEEKKMKYKVVK